MRYYFIFLLVIISEKGITQSSVDSLINRVETGIGRQAVLPPDAIVITKNLYEVMKAEEVNGLSIAVINNDKIDWSKGYGIIDKSKNDPVTTSTLFQCASIGKTITAMAALHLVKEGRLNLDENVNDKLIRWKVSENNFTLQEKVTLRRLLSHASGLADDYGFAGYAPGNTIPSLLQILNNEPPATNKKKLIIQAVPRTVERYSGGGYLIVQQLIEDVTHQSFSSYVQETIFDRLDMGSTTYEYYPDSSGKPIARGHDQNGNIDKKEKYRVYPEMAAAGPWTTATDLAKLVIQIQKEYRGISAQILDQKLSAEMLSPQINFKGLGVHLTGAEKAEAFWHAGNNEGFTALFYGIIHTGKAAVVLTNSDKGESVALQVITSIATIYDWPVMKSYRSLKLSADEIQHYKGQYQTAKGSAVEIGENKNGLFILLASSKKEWQLYKISDSTFTLKDSPDFVRLFFKKDNSKTITLMIAQKLGKIDMLKKINEGILK